MNDKREVIIEFQSKFELESRLNIDIIIEEGYTPGFFLDKKVIDFAHAVQAEIEVDLYANPYIGLEFNE